MLIKLLCDDGAVFQAQVKDVSSVSGVRFRGRHFFFRNFKVGDEPFRDEPYCEFEQGIEIILTDDEVQKEKA